jgi:hypothetical protein
MLYALLDADRGVFLRSPTAKVFSSHVFEAPVDLDANSPVAHQAVSDAFAFMLIPILIILQGILHGIPMKGYSGSDVTVKAVIEYTEEVTSAKRLGR